MSQLTLAAANEIVAAAFANAAELGLKPLGVAVLDPGGHLVTYQRQDGASFLRLEIASGKAYGALGMGAGSRRLQGIAIERPYFASALAAATGGKAVPVAGAALVMTKDGEIIGAVGISGDTADNDEACALAAIEAAGFVGDGG